MSGATAGLYRSKRSIEARRPDALASMWKTSHSMSTGSPVVDLAWSPTGRTLAVAERSGRIWAWTPDEAPRRASAVAFTHDPRSLAWSRSGTELAVAARDLSIVDVPSGKVIESVDLPRSGVTKVLWCHERDLLYVLARHFGPMVYDPATGTTDQFARNLGETVAGELSPDGLVIATAFAPQGFPGEGEAGLYLWGVEQRMLIDVLPLQVGPYASLAWLDNSTIAVGSPDGAISIWDCRRRAQMIALEQHTSPVRSLGTSHDGLLFVSRSTDGSTTVWRARDHVPVGRHEPTARGSNLAVPLRFNPRRESLALTGDGDKGVHVGAYDTSRLTDNVGEEQVVNATAKIVLLGESGVGKSGLGWRIAKGEFQNHASTHGSQFWVLDQLQHTRDDGVACESVLWDLAGQPDYRIIHSLFVEDADLALVLFDPTDSTDPLSQTEYWLKTFSRRLRADTPLVLVGARVDRGGLTVSNEEITQHCERWGARGYVETSALTGSGVSALLEKVSEVVRWDEIVATKTTKAFDAVKRRALQLKETTAAPYALVTFAALATDVAVQVEVTDDEVRTATARLAKHGFVRVLETQDGPYVLLRPELINNLAASFVLEARRNAEGLGSLVEERAVAGGYTFPEVEGLEKQQRDILLRAVIDLLLRHTICFAETSAVATHLVFPELVNVRRSHGFEDGWTEDVTYRILTPTENLYASLVVLLGYTGLFRRAEHGRHSAEYAYRDSGSCGFRMTEGQGGELDFVLYHRAHGDDLSGLNLFRALFERILVTKSIGFTRYPRVRCGNCDEFQERAVVMKHIDDERQQTFCATCGKSVALTSAAESLDAERLPDPIPLQRQAAQRAVFEQALAAVRSSVREAPPSCFISYAWDDSPTTEWVRDQLAPDLRHAGITVILDRWWTSFGDNVARWVEDQLPKAGYVIAVCTPEYRRRYDRGSVIGAEVDLINARLTGAEASKRSVVPILRRGESDEAIPMLMAQRLWADLRDDDRYLLVLLELILALHKIERTLTPFADHLARLESLVTASRM